MAAGLGGCSACGGFVPAASTLCPNCGVTLVSRGARRPGLVGTALKLAGSGVLSVTLMACYGQPPCDTPAVDADGDGESVDCYGMTDCNDSDATIHTGAADPVGDGLDQNCDGVDGNAMGGAGGGGAGGGGAGGGGAGGGGAGGGGAGGGGAGGA